jgi:IclR family transcriptional regulator, acetate operon repressor
MKLPSPMSTVDKALTLLARFSVENAHFGLTDLARALSFDKATTLRLLRTLSAHGLLEQEEPTKSYRLGPTVVRLARIREASFPLVEIAKPIVESLSQETTETCHLSEAAGWFLTSLLVVESKRPVRTTLSAGQELPLHATASGLAYLAYAPKRVLDQVLKMPLRRYTPKTISTRSGLMQAVACAAKRGFSFSEGGYDPETVSTAAPIRASNGTALGAISVAWPLSRTTRAVQRRHAAAAVRAAAAITKALGGAP